jgi:hypothetical protein
MENEILEVEEIKTYIGQKWIKPDVYLKENADWCIENKAKITDKGDFYEVEAIPEPTITEQNKAIRATREQLYSSSPCADYKYDYEEDVARYGQDSEQAKASADIWLAEKDKIRTENPYIEEDNSDSVLSGEPEKMAQ